MCDGSPTNHEASGAEVFYAVEKGFGLILSERNMVLGSVVVDQLSYFKTANDPQHIWVYNRAFKTKPELCPGHRTDWRLCLIQQQMVLCKCCSEHLVW